MRKRRNLSLKEKWEIDSAMYENGGVYVKTFKLQCISCNFRIKGEIYKCEKYKERKPQYVLSYRKECINFEHETILEITPKTGLDKEILGGVIGSCVGDALGVPMEFTNREILKLDPVVEMRAYGTHHQYFGVWSDDSSMTFCLMESLINGYSLNDIANKFCKFYYESYWTPNNKVFDIGSTTAISIQNIKKGMQPIECGGSKERDNGNGSLMRILPLAYYLLEVNPVDKIRVIEEVSSITHSHKRSKLACIIYVEIAINLLKNKRKELSYRNAVEFVKEYCCEEYKEELINYSRIIEFDIENLREEDIKSSGYVVDSLEASLWGFITTNNYKDAILKVINLGGIQIQ